MPDQPPTPSRVEELLRASAQRRRAEFDAAAAVGDAGQTAMPAAMRRRLHEEVLSRQSTGATVAAETETERAAALRCWPSYSAKVEYRVRGKFSIFTKVSK